MNKRITILAGAGVLALAVALVAQPPAGAPGGAKGGFGKGAFGKGGGKGKAGGRGTVAWRLEPGQPIETRPTELDTDKPAFPQQTRAPYVKTKAPVITTLTTELNNPWSIAFLPDGKMLITEKPGTMRTFQNGKLSEPLTGVPQVQYGGQVGLLDVALDKNFAQNRRIFFSYSESVPEGTHIVIASANLNAAATGITNSKVIFGADAVRGSAANQGGRLVVDADGNIFAMIGDRVGPAQDAAQRLDSTLGKTIHITPDGKPAPGNPFIGQAGAKPEIYSLGHRSEEGLAIRPGTNELWEIEHGPQGGDELNRIEKGKNYGWPVIVHGVNYGGAKIGDAITEKAGMEQPVYYWDPVIAPSGMAFVTGNEFPEWRNSVLVGALGGQMLDRLQLDANSRVVGEEPLMLGPERTRIRDVRMGPDGAVYVLSDTNSLFKLTSK